MLDVNLSNLKIEIDRISSIIDDYDEVTMNLFKILEDSCQDWQDGNSVLFSQKISEEKSETFEIFNSLLKRKEILDYVLDSYIKIGKRITVNLNNKRILLNNIQDCYTQAANIYYYFNQIDTSFYYAERQTIWNQQSKVKNIMDEISNISTNIKNLYSKIEGIEQEIKLRINKLEQIKINDFDFDI